MTKTTLHFTSFAELWKFKMRVQHLNIIVLEKLKVLVAELTEEEVQYACLSHQATVVKRPVSYALTTSNAH
jgi:hypothetical protein